MPCVAYIANGICRKATADNPLHGWSEMRVFNTQPKPVTVKMRVYYADRPPADIPSLKLKEMGCQYLAIPKLHEPAFAEVGPWGMRLTCENPLVTDHILIAGIKGKHEEIRFAGGVSDTLAQSRLARLWYFGDGLQLKFDPAQAPLPFNEFEWYHLLNPNPTDSQVRMQCFYDDDKREEYRLDVAAQRVLLVDNRPLVRANRGFGIRFVCTQPMAISSTRLIYGLNSMDEWGAQIHTPRPGLPAPLEWNEDDGLAES
ncbi:MAG: hypothetical protein IT443_09015 [Phycisphaeraceae bacterium]|nr:hypothetical protein [Phycisphaeraceae bacterium]